MSSPLVIALVSGKGGVGKTMLSVAVAKELSLSNRTLIVDLDFFNRGLTGLMGKGESACEIDKPVFLLDEGSKENSKWSITKVAKNLFHIAYPDLLPEEMQRFETLDVNVLKSSLQKFIEQASEKCECECVVLDCHGGPDNSSFAACLFADYSLLVSEPDRITFYGTLNFLRQLKRISGEQQTNLHLVFNKVVPAFSGIFLRSLYNRLIRGHFSGRPLLAIFPLEVYLTKEFEKTPFLTAVYPYSWLAKKTRTLLCDLMSAEHPEKLPPSVLAIPKWLRSYTRLSLGKQLPLFNMNVVMLTVVGVVVFLAMVALSLYQFFPTQRQLFRDRVARIAILQCVNRSSLLLSNPDAIKDILQHPSGRSEVAQDVVDKKIQEFRKASDSYDDLQNALFEDKPLRLAQLEQKAKEVKSRQNELEQLSDFRHCAAPDAYVPLNYSEYLSLDYSRYLRGSRALETPDYLRRAYTGPIEVYDPLEYQILGKRRQVLNSLKPEAVPKEYAGDYERNVRSISNMSLIYLALQTISDKVFNSSGSRWLAIAGGTWLVIVLLFTWSGQLDRLFTYYSRSRRFAALTGPYLVALILWFLPLLGVATLIGGLAPYFNENPPNRRVQFEIILVVAIPMLTLATGQIMRIYRDLRFEGRYLEGFLRAGFLAYFLLSPLVIYRLFMR